MREAHFGVMADDEFKFDLLQSAPKKDYSRQIGVAAAVAVIIFIIATMTTNVASTLLPMSDEYMEALVPTAPDGSEALSLQSLNHEIVEKTMTVHGTIANRTENPLREIHAVVVMQDVFGFPRDVEVPVDPAEIPIQGTAAFTASATLDQQPGGYIVKFRIADGPYIPHKDDRAANYAAPPPVK
ncbi:MAG: hypothetical protein HY646_16275 [Acidobacteria bacterium]|nr:hypothetical protein [Acidobacteriota bacterium]